VEGIAVEIEDRRERKRERERDGEGGRSGETKPEGGLYEAVRGHS